MSASPTHLGIDRQQIGVVGAGRSRPRGVVDIAMVQSLVDARVPVLARMHTKRLGAYASLGFDVRRAAAGRS